MSVDIETLKKIIDESIEQKIEDLYKKIDAKIIKLEKKIDDSDGKLGVIAQNSIILGKVRPSWINALKIIKYDYNGGATISVIAEKLNISRSVASSYLTHLIEMHLLQRKHNHTDLPGRYLFVITEDGEKTINQLNNIS